MEKEKIIFDQRAKINALNLNSCGTLRRATPALRLLIPVVVAIIMLTNANSFTANGTGKTFDFKVTAGNNADASSSNFQTHQVIGDITSVISSANFRTELGFLRTLPYLDGESCQNGLECLGGFCCSNLCSSSACPTAGGGGAAPSAAAGGGGGGGSPATAAVEDFSVSPQVIRGLIKQGGIYSTKFSIANTGTSAMTFSIDYSALRDLVLLSDTSFTLPPNGVKEIGVTMFAAEEKKPDVYTGNIVITGNSITKSLPVIIEVQAKNALFDITVKVPASSKNVLKSEHVFANVTLINVGDLKPVDAVLYYSIRDIEGKDIIYGSETLAIYEKVSRIEELELPPDIKLGTYLFYGKVSYGKESAAAVDVFSVVSEKPATCFDGIKNQNEEGVDCGGVCAPCSRLSEFFKIIPSFLRLYLFWIVTLILLLIIIMLLALLLRRITSKGHEKKRVMENRKKMSQIFHVIALALSRGNSASRIKSILLAKGFSGEFTDKIINLAIKKDRELLEYIYKSLRLGYLPSQIRKSLLEAGWPEVLVDKCMPEALKISQDKNNQQNNVR